MAEEYENDSMDEEEEAKFKTPQPLEKKKNQDKEEEGTTIMNITVKQISAIQIEISGGCVGWGEAPIFPSVTAEDQLTAMVKAREGCEFLRKLPKMKLGDVLQEIGLFLPGHRYASVRAGMEIAMIDAAAKSVGTPLWKLFGGASSTVTTDITVRFYLFRLKFSYVFEQSRKLSVH